MHGRQDLPKILGQFLLNYSCDMRCVEYHLSKIGLLVIIKEPRSIDSLLWANVASGSFAV